MTNYRGLNSLLVRALTALDEARDIVRDAQRAAIRTHQSHLANLFGCAERRLDSAYDEVTRARSNLLSAERSDLLSTEQAEGGDAE